MSSSKAKDSLHLQLLALQIAIVLGVVALVAVIAVNVQARQIRSFTETQVQSVARSMAALPTVIEGLQGPDPAASIAPIASLVGQASGVDFVVVTDRSGNRVSHPDPDLIGLPSSSDHAPVLAGEEFLGTEEGPVGVTLRAKVPVYPDPSGAVHEPGTAIGVVSVGLLESDIAADLSDSMESLAPWLVAAVVIGTAAAAWVSRIVRRRIYGLEPREILSLLQSHEAMMHGVRDGVVAVDPEGRIALINDEAARLLGVGADAVGRPMAEVLDADVVALLSRNDDAASEAQLVLAGERVLVAERSEPQANGRSVGRLLTLQDRTEAENTLRELEGQRSLAQTLRAQTHEFSNRLHVVSGLIGLGKPEAALDYIDSATRTGIVHEAAKLNLEDPTLAALLAAKAAVAAESGGVIRLDEASDIDPGWRSDDAVVTVLGNLINNALEATGGSGRIEVWLRCTPQEVRIQVDDDGPGVPVQARRSIFERGFSTKDGAQRGVGLMLVERIARHRGGTVTVGTSSAGGARFAVSLPGNGSQLRPTASVNEGNDG